MAIFEGEWNDKVYAVAGDVLDGYLYDYVRIYETLNFYSKYGLVIFIEINNFFQ